MNLSGPWSFQIDPDDAGLAERWYERPLGAEIRLPGSLQEQGYGDDVSVDTEWVGGIWDRRWFTDDAYAKYRAPGNVKVPFWLQPDKHYSGAAWYQRSFEAPAWWPGHRVTLTLERAHWATRAWLDGRELTAWRGTNASLSVPHVYELGDVAPGPHTLTVRVDNRMLVDVGPNAHSVSDHTQSNWNGLVGRIELAAGSPVWLDEVQVFPRVAERSALVRLRLGSRSGAASARVTLRAALVGGGHEPPAVELDILRAPAGAEIEEELPLGPEARLWDEHSPALYRLEVALEGLADGASFHDARSVTFGLREVGVRGTQITVNGRPIFLRGTLECAIFPRTGYPPTDVESWRRVMGVVQAHGLNHMRFHSWCPPEAAFDAADQLGVYLQVECAAWANQGATVGDGRPLDAWLYEEAHRIITAYGNHPSFLLMTYGNEPGGERHREYLAEWVRYWKQHEPRRLHTTGAGWPAVPENDYHNIPDPRVQRWGEELRSRINALPPETLSDYRDYVTRLGKPIVSHEIGQWCVYPNFAEVEKYTGVLKARNFEIFRDTLAANHMGDQAHDFLIASGKLQALCYKEDIESALRTPGFAGFQLLDLHDFPGQGTALVGVLDPFWEQKGYVTPEEFRRFSGSTVPLARLARRYWLSGETLAAELEVAHFGPEALTGAAATWRLVGEDGAAVAGGTLRAADIPTGGLTRLGTLAAPLGGVEPGRKYTLVAEVGGASNSWDVWVFPDELDTAAPPEVLVADDLDAAALARLAEGGKVLLALPPDRVRVTSELGFSSVFWNTAWTNRHTGDNTGQAPHTLGIVCDPAHPALAAFPTEPHSNWQWWELVHGAAAMTLDGLPAALRPLVQPIDTWFENRRLGLLFEARVGGGSLLVCSMNLGGDLERRPVARQMRHSLLRYMASDAFRPGLELSADDVRAVLR